MKIRKCFFIRCYVGIINVLAILCLLKIFFYCPHKSIKKPTEHTAFLYHLMNGSSFVKKSRRKIEHLRGLLHIKMNENTFTDSFLFRFNIFLSHCFSHLFAFCQLSHFEIIRCIVKLMIATSTCFLLKCNWKKRSWKMLFGHQSLGIHASILVSQTAWYVTLHL